MRVIVWPADSSGCGHYRLRWPAEAMAAEGLDVRISAEGPRVQWDRYWSGAFPPAEAVPLGVEHPGADVVVIQRPTRSHWTAVIPHLRAKGVRVVVDVDDDLSHIPPGNVARESLNPTLSPGNNWRWLQRAITAADRLIVTTAALQRRYGRYNRDTIVVPNRIPARLRRAPALGPRTLGWTGTVATHPYDLETTGGAVGEVLRTRDWQVSTVGGGQGVAERLGVAHVNAAGWVPIGAYHDLVADTIGVGIVPLIPGPFNAAKSALKLLEFSALGIPAVASPTPDNRRLAKLGAGLLADKPRAWVRHLSRLLDDCDYRAEVAERSWQATAAETIEAHVGDWHEAWTGCAA